MSQTNGSSARRVSVVINTYNRGASLRHTLHALRYQTYEPFEVIVVNGPSTDDTEKVLAEAGDVRVAHCPEVHLCKSRNIGIAAADGEIVAFIDDDALPETTWLEELVAAYDAADIAGAGGAVYDHTGFGYQFQYSVCDRLGNTRFDVKPPFDAYTTVGADPFVYLQGTNASFLRKCLVAIGGFDEEIEYYMDEVDVCRRIIDLGYRMRPLAGALVHHKYLASHRRNSKKVVFEPFPNIKNHCYLAILNNVKTRPLPELRKILRVFADRVKAVAHVAHAAGKFTDEQRDYFLQQVERGLEIGIDKGLRNQRLHREFPAADGQRFAPYRVLCPKSQRLKVCFVSQEYPPGDFGGIGRFTSDLATGMAALGHEVHVVTRSQDVNRVDFEDGVWMHRLTPQERHVPELDGVPLAGNLFHSAGIYHELCRIQASAPIDVVSAPLWACEGMTCSLDSRFPTVLSLMTSMKTLAGMHPSWAGELGIRQIIALEGITARRASALHAISEAILEKAQEDTGARDVPAKVVPLGIRDRSHEYRSRRHGGKVQVLFVGRLERRKGVDVLLEAAAELLTRHPSLEFVLAGKETTNTETGTTYRKAFEARYTAEPSITGRVTFAGAVSEEQLYQHYADADIVCMPSRYESFGLVLVEGMMFGKPVVGCAVGGMCEIVAPGANGFLAVPGDVPSLVDCLERLIESETLRREFGRRSRELYEARYAMPIVVENTLRYYREVSGRHNTVGQVSNPPEAGWKPAPRYHSDSDVAARLAEVIAEAGGISGERAAGAATRLLDRTHFPVDYVVAVRKLWHLSAEEFLKGLYPLLLKRDVDAAGLRHYLGVLQAGVARGEVVRDLALSEEARLVGLPTQWVEERAATAGPPAPGGWLKRGVRRARRILGKVARRLGYRGAAGQPAEGGPMSLLSTGRLGRLRALLSPGKAFRYVKRLLYLPWNFQKLYDDVQPFQELVPKQLAEVRNELAAHVTRLVENAMTHIVAHVAKYEERLTECMQTLATELTKDMRQLKYRFAEFYGALVEELRRQSVKLEQLASAFEKTEPAVPDRSAVEHREPGRAA